MFVFYIPFFGERAGRRLLHPENQGGAVLVGLAARHQGASVARPGHAQRPTRPGTSTKQHTYANDGEGS